MRLSTALSRTAWLAALVATPLFAQTPARDDAQTLRELYRTALRSRAAYDNLADLVTKHPGRLSGSKNLEGAVLWGEAALKAAGAERTELQPVMVPHWERGAPESVLMIPSPLGGLPYPLTAVALGGSVPTDPNGLRANVVELHTLDELKTTDLKGKIVFFNRAMNPDYFSTGRAYGEAGDARNRGAAAAAKVGAIGMLTRSLTLALDDVPHTGNTSYEDGVPRIPAAALSTLAANQLSAALKANPGLQVEMQINSQWFPDAPSHNVIGEIRGSEFPDQVILIGGHLDSWDITPGAHDDGAGVVQSIEVLRLLKAIGYQPRHTVRAVLFTSEENSGAGGKEYARVAGEKKELHLLAIESDSGGFQPTSFNFGNPAKDAHLRAARWQELFVPYGIRPFIAGVGGSDVHPLLATLGYPVAGVSPDSQRYFDVHHTRIDTMDKVNPRELALGAAAMASLVYLVDQHGL